MSTKIYQAWRCSASVLTTKFLPIYRKHCFEIIGQKVKDLMLTISDERITEISKEARFSQYSFEEFLLQKETVVRLREVFSKSDLASKSHYNDIYCMDCSLNIWLHKGKAYIIPYGQSWIASEFQLFEGLEDFCYWNNTDAPEGMDYKQWVKRGKIWEKVCLDDWNATRMTHEIVSLKESVGLFNICDTIVSQNDFYGFVMDYKWMT